MALPLGLPWLAGAILSVVQWFVSFLTDYLSKRLSVAIATIAAFLALTTAFVVGAKALISGISYSIPGWLATGAFMVPENTAVCFGVMMGVKISRWIYDFQYRNILLLTRG